MSEPLTADGVADRPTRAEGRRRWTTLACSEIGASHARQEIACQDHSRAEAIDDDEHWHVDGQGTWAFATVADGHGGVAHFRSEVGATLAVEAMRSAFVSIRKQLVRVQPPPGSPGATDPLCLATWKATAARLVVAEWRTWVYAHLLRQPPDERAPEPGLDRLLDHIRERQGEPHHDRLLAQIAAFRGHAEELTGRDGLYEAVENDTAPLPLPDDPRWAREELGDWQASAYGTTLLGVLIGPDALYWLRIGDGAMVQLVGTDAVELSPAPEEAIANQTPSLSDDRAVDQADVGAVPLVDGTLPSAVILASDGVPNSYREPAGFLEFCEEVVERATADRAAVAERMPHWLAELSRRGSGDDMSVAMAWTTGTNRTTEGDERAEVG